jgi:hypothetical protein
MLGVELAARRRRDRLDDELMTSVHLGRPSGQPLRTAAVGGLAFTVLYLMHRILQGSGPEGSTAVAFRLNRRSGLPRGRGWPVGSDRLPQAVQASRPCDHPPRNE